MVVEGECGGAAGGCVGVARVYVAVHVAWRGCGSVSFSHHHSTLRSTPLYFTPLPPDRRNSPSRRHARRKTQSSRGLNRSPSNRKAQSNVLQTTNHESPSPASSPSSTLTDPLVSLQFMQRSAASSTSSRTDTLAVREALVQESAKRDAALQARERSGPSASVDAETRWELSYVKKIDGAGRAAVVDWGYGEVVGGDGSPGAVSESESEPEPEQQGVKSGRMVFGKFRSKAEVGCVFVPRLSALLTNPPQPVKATEKDKDADSDSDAADTPKVKNVSLRGLTSISNSGAPAPEMVCHGCQKKGHTQARCPQAKCYACDGRGHMSMECPKRKTKKRQPMGFNSKEDTKRRRSGGY